MGSTQFQSNNIFTHKSFLEKLIFLVSKLRNLDPFITWVLISRIGH